MLFSGIGLDVGMSAPAARVAFVTGASSGIGRATALRLARSGYRVFATVRTEDAETSVLQEAAGLLLNVIRLDLLDGAAISRAVRTVVDLSGRIDVVVNNAGYGQLGAVEDLSRDVLRRQFEVNVFAASQICREVVPMMRVQRSGTIVNVSSIAGRVSVPLLGAYCASKFALEALSDALRVETRSFGVRVVLIEPGPVMTQFQEAVRWSRTLLPPESVYERSYDEGFAGSRSRYAATPERVAQVVLRAIESARPRARYRIRLADGVVARLVRVIPTGVLDWGVARWSGLHRRAE